MAQYVNHFNSSFDRLLRLQEIIGNGGSIDGTAHRYLIVAKNPG